MKSAETAENSALFSASISGVVRDHCGNESCSVVLSHDNRNGASLGRLLNLKLILNGAASS